jgi:hypothetical protein
MKTGIKSETIKRGNDYIGRCAVYEDGKRLYSFETEVRRLSRGDALTDARKAAHDLIVENVRKEWGGFEEKPCES